MAQQTLNIGSNANDGTGETLRAAMIKVNENFTEVYSAPGFTVDTISFTGNEISALRSNDDLVFKPAGTGAVQFPAIKIDDNNIVGTRSNDDINLLPSGTGSVVFGAIKIKGTSLSSDDSTTININDGLIVDGTLNVTGTSTLTGAAVLGSTLAVPSGLTTLSTLNVTGATSLVGTTTIDNLTLNDNIIGSSSNADIILTPGGTGSVVLPAVTINDNNITGTRSNEDVNINASGTGAINIGALKFAGTSISSDDSTTVNVNENLIVDGTLTTTGAATFTGATNLGSTLAVPSALTTLSTLSVTGNTTLAGTTTIDNITLNDNIIGTSSNADLNLTPGGTGSVVISNLTVDSNINITDNVIKTTQSNSDLVISPAGTGQVVISKADINGGAIDNTVIGGSTALAGTFTTLSATQAVTIDGVTISDNTVSSNASNANLELSGSGSGGVTISGFTFPTSDGSSGQFLKTDGLGNLSFATASATLSHSDIADGTTTLSTSATSTLNQFDKTVHRSCKYFISASDATNSRFEFVEANIIHDGTNAYISTFGSVSDYTSGLATYTADVSGDNVRLRVTNISADQTIFKFQRIAIDL
jgi:glutaredoxin|tara:strand:- start:5873 stop:7642 length:1770 start_codon:yes stop_codon:yes gene_type:complete